MHVACCENKSETCCILKGTGCSTRCLCFVLSFSSSLSPPFPPRNSAHGHTCAHTSYLSDVAADVPMSTFAFADGKVPFTNNRNGKSWVRTCNTGQIAGFISLFQGNILSSSKSKFPREYKRCYFCSEFLFFAHHDYFFACFAATRS